MYTLEATYQISTPLFLGRAPDHAELRSPSVRGALRFWFRATNLATFGSLEKLRAAEERLFGSAAAGTGRFLLRTSPIGPIRPVPRLQDWPRKPGSAYLGYGLSNRPYLPPGPRFRVTLLFPAQNREDTTLLVRALKALGFFGGLGSRSRNGFGSVTLLELRENNQRIWQAPDSPEGLAEEFRQLLGPREQLPASEPDFTAFSQHSRVLIVPQSHRFRSTEPAETILDAVGREMMCYRSYGRFQRGQRITAANEPAEQNFEPDHCNLWKFAKTGHLDTPEAPKRAVFGLPHPYFFSSVKLPDYDRVTVEVSASQRDHRRASPLFIHIHLLTQERHAAVFAFLPAQFLPKEETITLKRIGQRRDNGKRQTLKVVPVPAPVGQWQPILNFLQREAWKEGVAVW